MNAAWFEVWGDLGLSPPYLLIVMAYEGADSIYEAIDPQAECKCVYRASSYDKVRYWLGEDEYEHLSERISAD